MKALVTGANGFVGSKLAEALLRRGDDVHGLIRARSDLRFLKEIPIHLHIGDITNPDSLIEPMKGVEVLFHVAGLASDWGSLEHFRRINAQGTVNVLQAAKSAGVRKIVHVGTVAIMGFGRINVTEDSPRLPTSFPYVISKLEGEQAALEFASSNGLPLTVIRPGDVYGPHDRTWMLPMLTEMEKGKMGHVSGGRAELAPIYIDNLTQALLLAAEQGRGENQAFFITDGVHITWREIVRRLAELMGLKEPKLSVPYPIGYGVALVMEGVYKLFRIERAPLLTTYRIMHGGKDFHFKIDKARRILGYAPDQDIDSHLRKTIEWYQKYKKTESESL
ncbi:MAG: hypothetical protein B6244_01710 [Candidatus Cloacimonetes bacterium 4572_55]|nr:MAG: hypothetical protein B6244_01710 [Candidatus Cloacimonetes bacterium 4572_55]